MHQATRSAYPERPAVDPDIFSRSSRGNTCLMLSIVPALLMMAPMKENLVLETIYPGPMLPTCEILRATKLPPIPLFETWTVHFS